MTTDENSIKSSLYLNEKIERGDSILCLSGRRQTIEVPQSCVLLSRNIMILICTMTSGWNPKEHSKVGRSQKARLMRGISASRWRTKQKESPCAWRAKNVVDVMIQEELV